MVLGSRYTKQKRLPQGKFAPERNEARKHWTNLDTHTHIYGHLGRTQEAGPMVEQPDWELQDNSLA